MADGIVFDVQRYSLQDGPGLRTLVFLKGCPLRCLWCSNPESQQPTPEILYDAERCLHCGACARACPVGAVTLQDGNTLVVDRCLCTACGACVAACPGGARRLAGRMMSDAEVVEAALRDMPFYRRSGGGVTLGGGEPTFQPEFARAVLVRLKLHGVDTAIETCGCADAQAFLRLAELVDHILFDVKHADSRRHARLTGAGNESILSNLRAVVRVHPDVVVRYPVVPGCNDGDADMEALAALLSSLPRVPPLELVPYHRLGEHKYRLLGREYALAGTVPVDTEGVERLCHYLRTMGLSCSALSH